MKPATYLKPLIDNNLPLDMHLTIIKNTMELIENRNDELSKLRSGTTKNKEHKEDLEKKLKDLTNGYVDTNLD